MKRVALVLLALLTLVPSAGAGGPKPLWATEWRLGGGITLMQVSGATLQPIARSRIDAAYASQILARSPDRRYFAMAGDNQVRFVDLRARRTSTAVHPAGWVSGALWEKPDTLVTVVGDEVVLISRRALAVTRRIALGGIALAARRAGSRLAVLVAPENAVGALSLALVAGDGSVRSTRLEGVRGGHRPILNEERNLAGMYTETPGLAVDRHGRRAVVVGLDKVAVVELDRLAAKTHSLSRRTLQKRSEGWWRGALWLDDSTVATYGSDYHGDDPPTHAPLQLLDTSSWSARTLDVQAGYAISRGSQLITIGNDVRGFLPDGTQQFRILPGRAGGQVVAGESYLYAETSRRGTHWSILDPSDGRVMGRRTFARPVNLVEGF